MSHDIYEKITQSRIIAVITIEHIEDVIPIMDALCAGGITTVELTLRSTCALHAMSIIKKKYPQILLGAGTIIQEQHIQCAYDAGADFGLAPGCSHSIMHSAYTKKFPFIPGVSNPSDIACALEHGYTILKVFPFVALGGMQYLNAIALPYQHMKLQYIPFGGIHATMLSDLYQHTHIASIGGSWLAPPTIIAQKNYHLITDYASEALHIIHSIQ